MSDSPNKPQLTYFIRGTNPRGGSSVERVQAHSAQEAINQLRKQGFSDIKLETDDVTAAIPTEGADGPCKLHPEQQLKLRRSLGPPWFDVLREEYGRMSPLVIVVFTALIGRKFIKPTLDWVDIFLACCLLVPAFRAFFRPNSPTAVLISLETHYLNGRIDKALALVPKLEEVSRSALSPELHALSIAQWRSRILAKLGRLDDALADIETLRVFPTLHPAMFFDLQRTAYLAAREHQKHYECAEQFTKTHPDNPLGWLTMIDALTGPLNRPAEARACLNQLRKLPMSPELQAGTRSAEAGLLLAEGNYIKAKPLLEEGLRYLEPTYKRMPISRLGESVLRGELSIASARTGDIAAARKYFRQAQRLLEIHKVEPLLSRCKRELGIS